MIPANNFWSVVVYDSLSRSELQNGQPLPSISTYKQTQNQRRRLGRCFLWPGSRQRTKATGSRLFPGKGWFPIFRFYGPAQPFFDKSWKLEDITPVQ